MPAERNAFKLGLTMILFFVLLVGVLYFLAPTGGGDMTLTVRFPHNEFTTILKSGGEVVCGGYSVGAIRSLALVEMPDENIGEDLLYSVATISVGSSLGLSTGLSRHLVQGPSGSSATATPMWRSVPLVSKGSSAEVAV